MLARKRVRLAYACDCSGDRIVGRVETVHAWTGDPQPSCPWRALRDPFVSRVHEAYAWFESGQIGTYAPHASHKLIEGLGYYHGRLGLCQSKQMELDREERKKR
jgi:hypothetical protein